MRFLDSVLFASLSLASAAAQTATFATPAMGFVFDPALRSIRAIRGIPGASLLAEPVESGLSLQSAAIAPGQDFALAVQAGSGQLHLVRLPDGAARPLTGAMASASRIVFSPSGRSAVLYHDSARLQILTGIPDNPVVQDLTAPSLSGAPAALAISDDGALVVVSSSGPVWLLAADGAVLPLPLPEQTAAVSFRAGSHDFLAAAANGDVYLLRNPRGDFDSRLILAGDSPTADPVAVHLTPDGSRAYVASTRGMLTAIDVAAGSTIASSCDCRPEGIQPLKGRMLFRLTGVSRGPVMLLDGSESEPRIWFVPADAERSGQ